MESKVDEYLNKLKNWQPELALLRKIILDCGLNEEWKWSKPCYTHHKANILILYSLKECTAIGFFNGALLNDTNHILRKPGENTQAGRWIKFANLQEIMAMESIIKAYIFEAIEVENAGLKVELKQHSDYVVPVELEQKLNESPNFKTAFNALTPGRQRGYYIYIAGAKQAKSRMNRVENCLPRILKGKGINDCICGFSKRMPTCDGSHKYIA